MKYSWSWYSKLWKHYCLQKQCFKVIRPKANSFFNCVNLKGLKLIIRLRLGLSHLWDHIFNQSSQDCLNPTCRCGIEAEITPYYLILFIELEVTPHYLLHFRNYLHERKTLLNNIKSILDNYLKQSEYFVKSVLLFGNTCLDNTSNRIIVNTTINYITSRKSFDDSLFTF